MSVPTTPPRGHPMEPGQFPGPLYPPGAAPAYEPSDKSPFAVAIKRAIAHCGFWPWDPEGFDEAYSNAVAYGVEGNPNKAGVKAFQKWSGTIQPTGNWGEKSFNFARSVTIPQGRTHAGEPAWDQVCVQLTAQAYEAAHRPAEPDKATMPLREAALARLVGKLGLKESPAESNLQMFGDWYGENGVPWCAISASWAYRLGAEDIGKECPSFQTVREAGGNDRHDFVPYIVSDARGGRYGFSVVSPSFVAPGDLVCFNWGGSTNADPYEYDHVGLFEAWEDGLTIFSAIEGNTSLNNNSNGGEVMRRSRNIHSQGTTFVRVSES